MSCLTHKLSARLLIIQRTNPHPNFFNSITICPSVCLLSPQAIAKCDCQSHVLCKLTMSTWGKTQFCLFPVAPHLAHLQRKAAPSVFSRMKIEAIQWKDKEIAISTSQKTPESVFYVKDVLGRWSVTPPTAWIDKTFWNISVFPQKTLASHRQVTKNTQDPFQSISL